MSGGLNEFFFLSNEEQKRIADFINRFKKDFKGKSIPEELKVPDSLYCDYMIHKLSEIYGYKDAGKCFEYDFIRMRYFQMLENEQEIYITSDRN